ncbi:MAG: hypothetical protein ABMA13_20380 [Chthoniobacteraceae bacterium]
MQIEQVFGGLVGDTSAQAIQLRMRQAGQNVIGNSRILAWDAAGLNPIILLDPTTSVAASAAGSTVLFATAAFTTKMNEAGPAFAPDFTLANPIPPSYLAAGKITFESNAGLVYWGFAWGGAGYTGTNTGSTQNDSDGNFGAPFGSPLPTASFQGVFFDGPHTDLSTNNAADYLLTNNPGTVTRNNGNAFTVVPEPGTGGVLACAALVFGALAYGRRRRSAA